jgi:4-hydroxy-tetrahydrodipicolinate synthase
MNTPSDIRTRLSGTGVALITPFHTDGSIDFKALSDLVEWQIESGVEYLVVNGTTAESATTSTEEKAAILQKVKAANNGRLPIMYGHGGNHTKALLEGIKTIDWHGVDAVLSVTPYYNKPNQAGLVSHFETLASACPVPVLLYNVPGRTGISLQPQTVGKLAKHPNIIGIKEASGDILLSIEIRRYCPDEFMLIAGDDMLTVPMAAIGGVGSISVLANAFPHLYSTMTRMAIQRRFNDATEILKAFVDINPLLYEEGNPTGIKGTLALMGKANETVRLPLEEASAELKERIQECLNVLESQKWAND